MNETEDMQSGESEMIVKTVKEACVEGLVVTGGGKDGIFVKEVKLDSPASKHLSVKEGDQILSATVYFDNVSYEDALQILEHAQPYKMEFCLRRKVEPGILENAEIIHPKEKDQSPPMMRSQTKMKKQQERISWPKFPSFGKGPRMQFKRSHSTSEAEEHRKLEMSPPTSDTESPLKRPDGKDKKKKHKVQLKMKMKGHRSKSVEEPQKNEKALLCENQQVEDILEEKVPEGHEEKMQVIPQVLDGAENEVSSKAGNDDPFQSLSGMEMHEAHLISLGSTLKTTDISVALAEGGNTQSSEMKVRIHQKEKPDSGTEKKAETIEALYKISDPSACDNVLLSQEEVKISQLDNDLNRQGIGKDGLEKKMDSGNAELSMQNLDICEEVTKKSPSIGDEKQWKERSVFESESYGIRTRGPLADIATSKTHFVSTVNGLQFTSPDFSEIMQVGKMSDGIGDAKKPTVFQPKPARTAFAVDKEDSPLEIKTSKLPTETTDFILADLDKSSGLKFKLPKVDHSGFVTHELIKIKEVEKNRTHLPKREDIEIPGMETKETKPSLQTPEIKAPKTEKIINITKAREIEDPRRPEEFNVEDVKVAVSKFPAFKLPEGDITGVLVQREITIMELKSDKSVLTPRGSPYKISITSTDSSTSIPQSKVGADKSPASDTVDKDTAIKMPKVELPYIDEQISTAVMKIDETQPQITDYGRYGDINFKLPKREDIEIPGMEATKESKLQKTVLKAVSDVDLDQSEKPKTKKYGDKKGHEKKSKKPKINTQGFESTKLDIQSPDSTELPKKDSSKMGTGETKIHEKHKFKIPQVGEVENIDVSVQESKILEDNMKTMDSPQKTETKFGKTKFKIPSIALPEFETEVPRGGVNISAVDVQVKKAEKVLPEDKLKLSAEPKLSDLDDTDVSKDGQSVNVYGRGQDPETEGQGRKFKLPKFEISFPEVKAPRISCTSQKDDDSSVSEERVRVGHSPKAEQQVVNPAVSAPLPEADSEISEVKIKRPGFSFPRFGISKSEHTAPAADINLKNVEMSLPEGHTETQDPNTNIVISVKDGKQKDAAKFGSPTKFKIPSIKFPNFGAKVTKAAVETSNVNVDVKGAEISLPDTELNLSAEPSLVDIKEPDVDKQKKYVSKECINMDIQSEAQGSKFKLPKFEISIPEVEGPKVDISYDQAEIDISIPKRHVEVDPADLELQAGTTEVKVDLRTGLEKVNIPKTAKEISVDVDVKRPEISLPVAGIILSAEPLLVDIKGSDLNNEMRGEDIKIEGQGRKLKLPHVGISLPEVKGPKIDVSTDKAETDISVPKAKVEVHPPDVKVQSVTPEIKADMPEADSKGLEVKMKSPGFSFPRIGFSKSEVEAPDVNVSVPAVDVSLPEGSIEIERPNTDLTVSMEDTEQRDQLKFGSPTKFKLPSINFPKFGTKVPKATVEVSDVDVDVKGPEISLPDTEIKFVAEPLSLDIKGPDADTEFKALSTEIKDQDIQIKAHESKFKLPKFGISLPEVKAPKFDVSTDKAEIDISVPKAKAEVHPPDFEVQGVTAEIKADLPEVDSKDIDVKMKTPGFSFPKIGFSKSEVKAPEVDVSLPTVDVSLPEGSIEIEKPTTDVAVAVEDAEQKGRSKFGSPTKFKLPSINFPKFGMKSPKPSVEVSGVVVDVKGPEISLPDAEMKLSAEPLTVDIKGPDADKEMKSISLEMKDQEIELMEQGSKFKLPKFGISLPEVKGPKIDISSDKTEIDLSVPKAKVEVQPYDLEVQSVKTEIKADLPEVDSKGTDVNMKIPGFLFPKIEFSKSEVKAPEVDVSLPTVDVSLPEGSIEIEKPTTDVAVAVEDVEQKSRSKFGSPTKFKLPSINFPKFGMKGPKTSVEISDVEVDVKGPEISLPDAEMKLSAEPLTVDIKGSDAQKEMKPLITDMKDQDIQIKEQGTKFKLPKFGISLPEVKGPKFDVSTEKAEIDVSVPKAKAEVHPRDFEVQGVTAEIKADLPEMDSKDIEVKMKTPGFAFPRIGFSKSEVKAPEVDVGVPTVDVSLPEGSIEIEKPTIDVTVPMEDVEQKGRSKFGSPTKFKLPSINFPKFGTKGPKASAEVSHVEVDVKGPEISLPEAEVKLSAEPLTVDIKGPGADKEMKPLSMEVKDQDIELKEEGTKFRLPKFGITLPEVKGPKFDVSSDKAVLDISVPKAKAEVHPPDVEVQGVTADIKADLPEVDSKDIEVKMKTPGLLFPRIGFSKSEVKAPDVDVSVPTVDVSLPEGSIEIEKPSTGVTISMEDACQKDPTKFKLPSFTFPKFGAKGPEASVEVSDVDTDITGPEISMPDAKIKLPTEPLSVDTKGFDADKEIKSLNMEMKYQDIQINEQDSKIKLPKFGISLPDIKAPKFDVSTDKAEIDISVPKAKVEVHPPDFEVQGVTPEIKADLPEMDSKDIEVKMKTPGFAFPRIGFSKSEVKAPEFDVSLPTVDVSLPEGSIEIEKPTTDVTVPGEDAEQKGRSKFGSPTKFKLPSINFPKFGMKGPKASVEVTDVDVDVKGPEINLPDAEMKLSAEPISVDIKGPAADKEMKSVGLEMKDQDIELKGQGSKFKLPKFGISLPEVTGPKFDVSTDKAEIDISVPKAKAEVHPSDFEVQGVTAEIKADLPEMDSKDIEVKMKTPGFSFPRIGFSKSEVKAPEVDVSLPTVDVSLPEGSIEIEKPTTDVTVPGEDAEQKVRSKFGSPTKFKLPSINFPKFGMKGPKASVEVTDVDVDVKGPEINLLDTEMKLSAEPVSVDIKGPDADKEMKSVGLEMKDQDIELKGQGSKFKLPKFGISLPEVTGPKFDVSTDKAEIDISVPKAKAEVHPSDFEVQGVTAEIKADLPEMDSKDIEVKMKTPGFSFPRIGFSKSEVKAPEVDVSLPTVDVSLPEGSIEIEKPTTDVTVPGEDAEQKVRSKFGSPTKFKLPSINFPKFGMKGPKASVEVTDVDVDVKGPEISLPDAEIKLSAEPISVDIKGPDADKEMKSISLEMKDQGIELKEQGSKFKLPKFGISLPEVKGPKFDISTDKGEIDISVPKAKAEVHPPDFEVQGVTPEIKVDLPEVDSKDIEVKMKTPGFSLSRTGFSKSEVKAPEVDVSLPTVDVSLPEGSIEIERSTTDVTVPGEDAEQKGHSKFGSPTKFKLPSINFPKFGMKGPKASAEVSDVEVDVKGPEISLPDAEVKLSTEPLTVDIKGPGADKEMKSIGLEMKDQDIKLKEQGSKLKLPKFGISLPEVKGPTFDVSTDKAELDVSVPKAKAEVHPPDFEVQGVTAEIKADLPEMDSKDIEVKMKTPGFSFPKIGFSKSEVKAPEVDVSFPTVDVSLPEGSIEIERSTTDVTVPGEDAEQKVQSKFGSPTKFKLPSINFPKFGMKGPRASVEVTDMDVAVKGPEINLPDAEMKLSAEPVSVDIKGPDADKEMKSICLEMKDQDIKRKEQGSKFKLPKFGISLPEVTGPKFDISTDKAEIDISVPKAKAEVHPPDFEIQGVTSEIKADLPEVDSKDIEVKMKTPGFSFPMIAFSKSEVKAPDVDVSVPTADVSLPEGSIEIEKPTTDVKMSMEDTEQKGQSKFGSPTKFKLPSINFPKFGMKGPKASVEDSDVDVNIKGPEKSLPGAEIKLSTEPLTVTKKGPDADEEKKLLSIAVKDQELEIKEPGIKFKLPKFEIGLPEIKGPKFDISTDKAEIDLSVPKAKAEVHPPDFEVQGVTAEIKADLPEMDSKDIEVKMKTPGFSFPRIGFSKSEVKAPEVDVSLPTVDVSLPEGSIEIEKPTTDVTVAVEDVEQKSRSKFGSPTKFKLPSINFPKFGIKGPKASVEISDVDVDVDVKGPEISLPDAEMKLSAEPLTVDIKGSDADKEKKLPSMELKDQDLKIKEQESKFNLPKFGISLPEIKGPKFDVSTEKAEIDVSVPKAKGEVHPPDFEVQGVTAEIKADLPEVDSEDIEVKMKTPGFSFPRIAFSKSEVKAPEVDVSLPTVDVSFPEGSIEIERPTTDVSVPGEDAEQKVRSKFGSPTKFKLPSINFPKFGTKVPKATVQVSNVDADVKKHEINLPGAEKKLPSEPLLVAIKGPEGDKETKTLSTEMKAQDIQIKEQGIGLKMPKFGISFPEVKGPKIDVSSDKAEIDISLPKAKGEVHPPDVEVQDITAEVKADLPEVDSKAIDVKMKRPGLSFPRFNKSESTTPAIDMSLQTADLSLPEESIIIEGPTTDITEPVKVAGGKDPAKSSSQTKLKLPSIKFPKFGVKVQKETINISSMTTDVKEPEINLPDADLSAEPLSVDIKGHDVNKDENVGILHLKVKGPEINLVSKSSSQSESSTYFTKDVKIQSLNVKVKDAEINNEVAIPEVDAQVGKRGDEDTAVNDNALDVVLEPKQKYTQEVKTSSKFILPTLGDVFSGFEVEFHVPNFDEIEGAKKKYSDPLKHEQYIPKKAEHSPQSDINENESKKSFTREIDEDNVSPTLSLSSSDAFADVSSALTTEQIGLSLPSPTKVKVKYSEPTANTEVSDIHADIITSTARTELISMEPHQPEKVNIPFSSETSSSSMDTLKKMSGHIVVSNVQSVSKTEHTAILTKVETQKTQTLIPENVADSMLSVEEKIMRKGHTIVEKQVVKEIFGDDKEKIFVTQRIQVFEGDSTEPISDDTASSVQKLRDTVHTEKIRFFEGAESSKTILMSTETLLRHADSSTDENGGK
ncbi:neuroblast differentiation-associated protein AHNAK-like [Neoarius graeffei]|uniref:neuroblast differentiation-associated protein AHNAK-like n=1 Tax=Neoarius graeffei TaxID=443677 RepID=UPI00298CFEB5|nr:neuroblast differentiation-associated protein AHNAK-like [Neoarius graeffei]